MATCTLPESVPEWMAHAFLTGKHDFMQCTLAGATSNTASITEGLSRFDALAHDRAGGTAGDHSQRVGRSTYFPRDSRRGSIRRPDDSNSRFKFRVYPRSSSKTPNANAVLITETWESRRASTHTPSAKRSLRRSPRTCLSLSTSNTVVPEATSPPSML